jgi:hypothetical protein
VVPSTERPLLVSGDGDAWPAMARDGDLTGTGPVRYSGDVSDAAMPGVLADTDRVIVSDTNRRDVVTVNGFNLDTGPTLGAGQNQDRKASDLFAQPDSQSVAWFPDATRISATGAARGLRGAQPATRPAAAFDGDSATSWLTFESANQVGIELRVDLRKPTVVRDADLTTADSLNGGERITAATLRFSDGTSVGVPFAGKSAQVTFKPRKVSWIEIQIAAVSLGTPRPVGFSEISFTGLDLHEWISLPDDVVRRADANPKVAAELAALPLTFQFSRAQPSGVLPVEPILRRRFRVPSTRSFAMQAILRTAAADTTQVARTLGRGCGGKTLTVDGTKIPIRLEGSASDIRPGDPIRVEACSPVTLHPGWHELQVTGTPVSDLWLKSAGTTKVATASTTAAAPTVKVLSSRPGHFSLEVTAPTGGDLISSQSFEARWVATVNGKSIGDATSLDTLSGWKLPPGHDLHVTLDYRPQQRFGAILGITAVAVALCLFLVVHRPRRRRGPADQALPTSSS